MDWQLEILMASRALLATVLGGLVGYERESHGQDAGVRTYAAVALGACVFGLISSHALGQTVDTRIAGQIVSGVGFLGAGVIMRDQGRTTGLTTAATLWTSAAIGLAVAFGMFVLGALATALTFSLLAVHHLPGWNALIERKNCNGANEKTNKTDR
ncbi:MAG: MgtC/SapB family protein [Candidatus Melainabacteria bacterium]|jgi:putative Mg2+ transporter-C (MgtC) family protein|nr:MAG: MgtC/SapB family protein [Candidatus Melainabacteria bacterium]